MSRPTMDAIGLAMASTMATRSLCTVRQVGAAVASADWREWGFGYNGPPAGLPTGGRGCSGFCPQGHASTTWGLVDHPCTSVHAEVNAIAQTSRRLRLGGTFFVTAAPCWKCALAVANSGVDRAVWPEWEQEREELGRRVSLMYRQCGVELRLVGEGEGWPG